MGNIITFYSYKGGVGRSMALANTGVLLTQWGYQVLMIDFDLEAPGLENFFSSLLDLSKVSKQRGIVDFLYEYVLGSGKAFSENWKQDTVHIPIPRTKGKLSLWTAGKQDAEYFKKVRHLDFPEFYSTQNGGAFIEELRTTLKKSYDFILLDSRTGLTEIGGVSTVQLPDILVLLFTATEQAFRGALDIHKRASLARQKLPFERVNVPTVPVPSRLDAQAEFRLSQRWLDRFARELRDIYSSWLPRSLKPRNLLDVVKLPHVSYFTYGESLPVLEQGTTDPGGLGYAYENLAALLARDLQDVESFVDNREEYVKKAARVTPERSVKESDAKIFISYHHRDKEWFDRLKVHLMPLTRSRTLSVWDDTRIRPGTAWRDELSAAISEAEVAILLVSADYLASDFILENELPSLLKAAEDRGLRILWVALSPSLFSETEIGHFQALNDPSKPLSLLSNDQRERVLVDLVKKIAEAAGRSY